MRDGFLVRAVLLRSVAGRYPVGQGRTEIPSLLEMIGQQFRLRRADRTIIIRLQRGGDAPVADLPAAPEQAGSKPHRA